MNYSENLKIIKTNYPFQHWKDIDIAVYSDNFDAVKDIFDTLIDELILKKENTKENDKIACFKKAILSLNELNEKVGLIDTGEREILCDLVDEITIAANLNPEDYDDGEGISDLYRTW